MLIILELYTPTFIKIKNKNLESFLWKYHTWFILGKSLMFSSFLKSSSCHWLRYAWISAFPLPEWREQNYFIINSSLHFPKLKKNSCNWKIFHWVIRFYHFEFRKWFEFTFHFTYWFSGYFAISTKLKLLFWEGWGLGKMWGEIEKDAFLIKQCTLDWWCKFHANILIHTTKFKIASTWRS